MPGLKERIKTDLQEAVKSKEETAVLTLRGVLAAVLDKEKEKRYKSSQQGEEDLENVSLNEEEIISVLSSEAKKRKEAVEGYERGGREELAEKERKELEILQKYLPEQMSEEDLDQLIEKAIEKTGASGIKDMGKVMAEIMPEIKGQADGKAVSEKVKSKLT